MGQRRIRKSGAADSSRRGWLLSERACRNEPQKKGNANEEGMERRGRGSSEGRFPWKRRGLSARLWRAEEAGAKGRRLGLAHQEITGSTS
jgi:hypothetical protein